MDNKKVTLTAKDLRIVLTVASMGLAFARTHNEVVCHDPELAEMAERGQKVLNEICSIADDNKTFDLLVR